MSSINPSNSASGASGGGGGGTVFGSLPKAGFLRRGSNKKPPSPVHVVKTPTQSPSEQAIASESGNDGRSANKNGVFDTNYHLGMPHSGSSDSSEPFHDSHAVSNATLAEYHASHGGRRGSEVSSSSSSLPHGTTASNQYHHASSAHSRSHPHRNSLSSFASSSGGSPRATASLFSNSTTIGDLSTASMPLLPGGAPRASASSTTSSYAAASNSSYIRRDSLSNASDSSSVHSYPPKPRTRASFDSDLWRAGGGSVGPNDRVRSNGPRTSNGNDSDHNLNGSSAWSSGSSPYQSARRGSASSSFTGSTKGYAPHSIINYALNGSRSSSNHSNASNVANPLAPLRKRLARALAFPRRGNGFEIQLVLELIDALEHCVEEGQRRRRIELASTDLLDENIGDSSNATQAGGSPSSPEGGGAATPTAAPTATATTPPKLYPSSEELVEEVKSLIKELVEIAPDVRTCLVVGRYGPLSRSDSSNQGSTNLIDPGTPDWWPRRLSRDLRALLDDVGFAAVVRRRSESSKVAGKSAIGTRPGFDDVDELGEEDWETNNLNEALNVVVESLAQRQDGNTTNGVEEGSKGMGIGLGVGLLDEREGQDPERKEKLLVEGKRRWDTWKRSQEC